jgi:hypothetical protein
MPKAIITDRNKYKRKVGNRPTEVLKWNLNGQKTL